jgi:multidrug efflux system membrane fusion protein
MIRNFLAKIIGFGTFALTAFMVYLAWGEGSTHPQSDAAEIDAPVVQVSSNVPGRILSIPVQNNAEVKEGDVLIQIDPEPYRLRLEQAQAELRAAESEVAQGERNILTEESNADVAEKQIERAQFNAELAKQTLDRLTPLLERGFVTAQQVDQARTAYNDALVSLDQAVQQSQGATEVIGTLDTRRAQVDVAGAAVALAERDLENTTVRAPIDGIISGLTTARGEYVLTGEAVFAIIDSSAWEAVAFFRETQLPEIAVGDAVEVFIMADPERAVQGTVSALGWGVRTTDEVTLLGLPVVANSLNWVRVAKRFPVYIEMHDAPASLLRIGASAVVVVSGARRQDDPASPP